MHHYFRKQATIAFIFGLILIVIILGGYFLIRGKQPTCFDGIQNQGEKGIDCGGPCGICPEDIRRPLEILLEDFIPTVEDNYDLVAEIKNPNEQWGIESITYRFNLYDRSDQLIGFKESKTYILPQETRYIVDQRFYSTATLARVKFEIKNIDWWRLKDFEELELRIEEKQHQLIDGKFHQLSANVKNKSTFDLSKIEAIGLIFGENNKIIAAGKTEVSTLLSSEVRYFEINWPYETDRVISDSELKVHANVFLDETFIKKHGTSEKFKEY